MANIELLPCPFCGGAAGLGTGVKKLSNGTERYAFVNCIECNASTNLLTPEADMNSPEEAAAAWNRRTNHPNSRELNRLLPTLITDPVFFRRVVDDGREPDSATGLPLETDAEFASRIRSTLDQKFG